MKLGEEEDHAALCIELLACGATAHGATAAQVSPVTDWCSHSFGNAPKDGWQPWGSPTLLNGRLTHNLQRITPAVGGDLVNDSGKTEDVSIEHRFGHRCAANWWPEFDLANPLSRLDAPLRSRWQNAGMELPCSVDAAGGAAYSRTTP